MSIFNQYSFLFVAIAGALVLGVVIWRFPLKRTTRLLTLVAYGVTVLALIIAIQFPTSNDEVDSYAQVETVIDNGRPTLVMLYSHFCVGCIASLPVVRQLEDQLESVNGQDIDMLFIDIHTEMGKVTREQLGFQYTPTYILYDDNGVEVLRTNSTPTLARLRAELS